MNAFDRFTIRYKWLLLPILYVVICVWTYFGTTVTIEGYELPQHEAGVYGVIGLHVMGFLAVLGAYLLHWIVELLSKIKWNGKRKK